MQRNGEIAVRERGVKRRHFSKIGEMSAYLFTNGNDPVKSKKSHSQNDNPHFASAPIIQRMHRKHI